jgi:predicted metal-dependent peptidase
MRASARCFFEDYMMQLNIIPIATDAQRDKAAKRLTKAKTQLCMDKHWSLFSALILGIESAISDIVPTAGTNGKTTFYNAIFVDSLTDAQLRFLVLHETMHCALEHVLPSRYTSKDRRVYNIACDVVINFILCDNTEFTKVTVEQMSGLYDKDMYDQGEGNAEKIYRILRQEQRNPNEPPPTQPDGQPGDQPGPAQEAANKLLDDTHEQFDDCTVEPVSDDEEFEVKVQIKEALARLRKPEHWGKLSSAMQRLIEDLDIDKPAWTSVLDNFLASDKVKRDWSRPNGRFASMGMYMPSRGGQSVGCVVISLDVSGSVSQAELNHRAAEIHSVVENYHPQKLVVLSHDVQAYLVGEFDQDEDPDLNEKVQGSGGTSFIKVIEMAAEYDPEVMILLTDLYGRFPDEPAFPVVWASTAGEEAPFGEVILVDGDF